MDIYTKEWAVTIGKHRLGERLLCEEVYSLKMLATAIMSNDYYCHRMDEQCATGDGIMYRKIIMTLTAREVRRVVKLNEL